MKKILCSIVFLFSLSFTQDFNLTGAGARAEGFGGAFIGLADDATAIVWNPAGLSQLERPEASLVTRFISEGADFTYTPDPSNNGSISQSHFALNFGSVAYPVKSEKMSFVVALAFQRQLDFYDDQKFQYDFTDNIGNPYTYDFQSKTSGGANTITIGLGARFMPVFSLGAAVNIWTGSLTMDQKLTLSSSTASGFLQYKGDEDFSGTNFVIGGLLDLSSLAKPVPLKIGVSLKTPFTLTGTGSFTSTDNNFFSTGTTTSQSDVSEVVEMPLMLGFGLSYNVSENLILSMDYEIRSYGDKTSTTTQTPTNPPGNPSTSPAEPISQSKNGLNQFRIGGEYLVIMDNGVIPLRVGFRTVPTVFADLAYDPVNDTYVPTTTQVSGSGFSLGSGFISDAFAFDVTYNIATYTQKYGADGEMKFSTGTLSSSVIIYF